MRQPVKILSSAVLSSATAPDWGSVLADETITIVQAATRPPRNAMTSCFMSNARERSQSAYQNRQSTASCRGSDPERPRPSGRVEATDLSGMRVGFRMDSAMLRILPALAILALCGACGPDAGAPARPDSGAATPLPAADASAQPAGLAVPLGRTAPPGRNPPPPLTPVFVPSSIVVLDDPLSGRQPFPPTNWWNEDISAAPVDANS